MKRLLSGPNVLSLLSTCTSARTDAAERTGSSLLTGVVWVVGVEVFGVVRVTGVVWVAGGWVAGVDAFGVVRVTGVVWIVGFEVFGCVRVTGVVWVVGVEVFGVVRVTGVVWVVGFEVFGCVRVTGVVWVVGFEVFGVVRVTGVVWVAGVNAVGAVRATRVVWVDAATDPGVSLPTAVRVPTKACSTRPADFSSLKSIRASRRFRPTLKASRALRRPRGRRDTRPSGVDRPPRFPNELVADERTASVDSSSATPVARCSLSQSA
jgi:hypothetical protein